MSIGVHLWLNFSDRTHRQTHPRGSAKSPAKLAFSAPFCYDLWIQGYDRFSGRKTGNLAQNRRKIDERTIETADSAKNTENNETT